MKRLLITVSVIAALAGCSTPPAVQQAPEKSETIQEQQLISTFARNSIKLEWSCKFVSGGSDKGCVKGELSAIETTGYAPSFGTTEALREVAFSAAHDAALAKLVHFIKQDVSSTRVTRTLTKNIEKANDLIKHNSTNSASETDDEANADSANTVDTSNTNSNEIVRKISETIRVQANGIVRGAQVINESIVDKKTVAVTIRWSIKNANQVNAINHYFK